MSSECSEEFVERAPLYRLASYEQGGITLQFTGVPTPRGTIHLLSCFDQLLMEGLLVNLCDVAILRRGGFLAMPDPEE